MEEPVEYRARLIGDALRHQTLIIVLAVLLGSLLGYGASIARPGSYVATATVLINEIGCRQWHSSSVPPGVMDDRIRSSS